jgi:hypothetical protein
MMKKTLILTTLMALIAGGAMALPSPSAYINGQFQHVFHSGPVPMVSLHSSNVGIGAIDVNISGYEIEIWEDWTTMGPGMLEISGLELFSDYNVTKYITNNTGVDWDHFANELLDPSGNENDQLDMPTAPWVPVRFSHSNEYDGLSFAQGSGIPRTSTSFASRVDDELGGRDYIDFYDGLISGAGGQDIMTFGLRNHTFENEPFILAQRPNEYTGEEPVIPEPTTLILLGLGLAGVALKSRFSK